MRVQIPRLYLVLFPIQTVTLFYEVPAGRIFFDIPKNTIPYERDRG